MVSFKTITLLVILVLSHQTFAADNSTSLTDPADIDQSELPTDIDLSVEHEVLKNWLDGIMAAQNSKLKVIELLKATRQVVANIIGTSYRVKYEAADPKTDQKSICDADVVVKEWESKEQISATFTCVKTGEAGADIIEIPVLL